ncbi:uncharacterized protein [Diadema antillarum]|uniref:uncharacterized protein n=1 Tax=Diadema antillarum TaxID=105358 RepID=UPI003A89B6D8
MDVLIEDKDESGLTTPQILRKDFKAVSNSTTKVGFSSITLSLQDVLNRGDLGDCLWDFCQEMGLDMDIVMTIDLEGNRQLAIYSEDQDLRETVEERLQGSVLDLERLDSGVASLSAFDQQNRKASRKVALPLVENLLRTLDIENDSDSKLDEIEDSALTERADEFSSNVNNANDVSDRQRNGKVILDNQGNTLEANKHEIHTADLIHDESKVNMEVFDPLSPTATEVSKAANPFASSANDTFTGNNPFSLHPESQSNTLQDPFDPLSSVDDTGFGGFSENKDDPFGLALDPFSSSNYDQVPTRNQLGSSSSNPFDQLSSNNLISVSDQIVSPSNPFGEEPHSPLGLVDLLSPTSAPPPGGYDATDNAFPAASLTGDLLGPVMEPIAISDDLPSFSEPSHSSGVDIPHSNIESSQSIDDIFGGNSDTQTNESAFTKSDPVLSFSDSFGMMQDVESSADENSISISDPCLTSTDAHIPVVGPSTNDDVFSTLDSNSLSTSPSHESHTNNPFSLNVDSVGVSEFGAHQIDNDASKADVQQQSSLDSKMEMQEDDVHAVNEQDNNSAMGLPEQEPTENCKKNVNDDVAAESSLDSHSGHTASSNAEVVDTTVDVVPTNRVQSVPTTDFSASEESITTDAVLHTGGVNKDRVPDTVPGSDIDEMPSSALVSAVSASANEVSKVKQDSVEVDPFLDSGAQSPLTNPTEHQADLDAFGMSSFDEVAESPQSTEQSTFGVSPEGAVEQSDFAEGDPTVIHIPENQQIEKVSSVDPVEEVQSSMMPADPFSVAVSDCVPSVQPPVSSSKDNQASLDAFGMNSFDEFLSSPGTSEGDTFSHVASEPPDIAGTPDDSNVIGEQSEREDSVEVSKIHDSNRNDDPFSIIKSESVPGSQPPSTSATEHPAMLDAFGMNSFDEFLKSPPATSPSSGDKLLSSEPSGPTEVPEADLVEANICEVQEGEVVSDLVDDQQRDIPMMRETSGGFPDLSHDSDKASSKPEMSEAVQLEKQEEITHEPATELFQSFSGAKSLLDASEDCSQNRDTNSNSPHANSVVEEEQTDDDRRDTSSAALEEVPSLPKTPRNSLSDSSDLNDDLRRQSQEIDADELSARVSFLEEEQSERGIQEKVYEDDFGDDDAVFADEEPSGSEEDKLLAQHVEGESSDQTSDILESEPDATHHGLLDKTQPLGINSDDVLEESGRKSPSHDDAPITNVVVDALVSDMILHGDDIGSGIEMEKPAGHDSDVHSTDLSESGEIDKTKEEEAEEQTSNAVADMLASEMLTDEVMRNTESVDIDLQVKVESSDLLHSQIPEEFEMTAPHKDIIPVSSIEVHADILDITSAIPEKDQHSENSVAAVLAYDMLNEGEERQLYDSKDQYIENSVAVMLADDMVNEAEDGQVDSDKDQSVENSVAAMLAGDMINEDGNSSSASVVFDVGQAVTVPSHAEKELEGRESNVGEVENVVADVIANDMIRGDNTLPSEGQGNTVVDVMVQDMSDQESTDTESETGNVNEEEMDEMDDEIHNDWSPDDIMVELSTEQYTVNDRLSPEQTNIPKDMLTDAERQDGDQIHFTAVRRTLKKEVGLMSIDERSESDEDSGELDDIGNQNESRDVLQDTEQGDVSESTDLVHRQDSSDADTGDAIPEVIAQSIVATVYQNINAEYQVTNNQILDKEITNEHDPNASCKKMSDEESDGNEEGETNTAVFANVEQNGGVSDQDMLGFQNTPADNKEVTNVVSNVIAEQMTADSSMGSYEAVISTSHEDEINVDVDYSSDSPIDSNNRQNEGVMLDGFVNEEPFMIDSAQATEASSTVKSQDIVGETAEAQNFLSNYGDGYRELDSWEGTEQSSECKGSVEVEVKGSVESSQGDQDLESAKDVITDDGQVNLEGGLGIAHGLEFGSDAIGEESSDASNDSVKAENENDSDTDVLLSLGVGNNANDDHMHVGMGLTNTSSGMAEDVMPNPQFISMIDNDSYKNYSIISDVVIDAEGLNANELIVSFEDESETVARNVEVDSDLFAAAIAVENVVADSVAEDILSDECQNETENVISEEEAALHASQSTIDHDAVRDNQDLVDVDANDQHTKELLSSLQTTTSNGTAYQLEMNEESGVKNVVANMLAEDVLNDAESQGSNDMANVVAENIAADMFLDITDSKDYREQTGSSAEQEESLQVPVPVNNAIVDMLADDMVTEEFTGNEQEELVHVQVPVDNAIVNMLANDMVAEEFTREEQEEPVQVPILVDNAVVDMLADDMVAEEFTREEQEEPVHVPVPVDNAIVDMLSNDMVAEEVTTEEQEEPVEVPVPVDNAVVDMLADDMVAEEFTREEQEEPVHVPVPVDSAIVDMLANDMVAEEFTTEEQEEPVEVPVPVDNAVVDMLANDMVAEEFTREEQEGPVQVPFLVDNAVVDVLADDMVAKEFTREEQEEPVQVPVPVDNAVVNVLANDLIAEEFIIEEQEEPVQVPVSVDNAVVDMLANDIVDEEFTMEEQEEPVRVPIPVDSAVVDMLANDMVSKGFAREGQEEPVQVPVPVDNAVVDTLANDMIAGEFTTEEQEEPVQVLVPVDNAVVDMLAYDMVAEEFTMEEQEEPMQVPVPVDNAVVDMLANDMVAEEFTTEEEEEPVQLPDPVDNAVVDMLANDMAAGEFTREVSVKGEQVPYESTTKGAQNENAAVSLMFYPSQGPSMEKEDESQNLFSQKEDSEVLSQGPFDFEGSRSLGSIDDTVAELVETRAGNSVALENGETLYERAGDREGPSFDHSEEAIIRSQDVLMEEASPSVSTGAIYDSDQLPNDTSGQEDTLNDLDGATDTSCSYGVTVSLTESLQHTSDNEDDNLANDFPSEAVDIQHKEGIRDTEDLEKHMEEESEIVVIGTSDEPNRLEENVELDHGNIRSELTTTGVVIDQQPEDHIENVIFTSDDAMSAQKQDNQLEDGNAFLQHKYFEVSQGDVSSQEDDAEHWEDFTSDDEKLQEEQALHASAKEYVDKTVREAVASFIASTTLSPTPDESFQTDDFANVSGISEVPETAMYGKAAEGYTDTQVSDMDEHRAEFNTDLAQVGVQDEIAVNKLVTLESRKQEPQESTVTTAPEIQVCRYTETAIPFIMESGEDLEEQEEDEVFKEEQDETVSTQSDMEDKPQEVTEKDIKQIIPEVEVMPVGSTATKLFVASEHFTSSEDDSSDDNSDNDDDDEEEEDISHEQDKRASEPESFTKDEEERDHEEEVNRDTSIATALTIMDAEEQTEMNQPEVVVREQDTNLYLEEREDSDTEGKDLYSQDSEQKDDMAYIHGDFSLILASTIPEVEISQVPDLAVHDAMSPEIYGGEVDAQEGNANVIMDEEMIMPVTVAGVETSPSAFYRLSNEEDDFDDTYSDLIEESQKLDSELSLLSAAVPEVDIRVSPADNDSLLEDDFGSEYLPHLASTGNDANEAQVEEDTITVIRQADEELMPHDIQDEELQEQPASEDLSEIQKIARECVSSAMERATSRYMEEISGRESSLRAEDDVFEDYEYSQDDQTRQDVHTINKKTVSLGSLLTGDISSELEESSDLSPSGEGGLTRPTELPLLVASGRGLLTTPSKKSRLATSTPALAAASPGSALSTDTPISAFSPDFESITSTPGSLSGEEVEALETGSRLLPMSPFDKKSISVDESVTKTLEEEWDEKQAIIDAIRAKQEIADKLNSSLEESANRRQMSLDSEGGTRRTQGDDGWQDDEYSRQNLQGNKSEGSKTDRDREELRENDEAFYRRPVPEAERQSGDGAEHTADFMPDGVVLREKKLQRPTTLLNRLSVQSVNSVVSEGSIDLENISDDDEAEAEKVHGSFRKSDASKSGLPPGARPKEKKKIRAELSLNLDETVTSPGTEVTEDVTPAVLTPTSTEMSWEDDTPMNKAEPIEEYSAREEHEDRWRWRKVSLGGKEYNIDMKAINPYKKVLSHGGYYGEGLNAIIVFASCYLPEKTRKDYTYIMNNLFLYVVSTLELLVAQEYILIYFHGSASRAKVPSITWMRKCYQMIDRKLRKSLKGLYLVHPTTWLKAIVQLTKPFISHKFSNKLKFVKSLSELRAMVPMEYVYVPEEVKRFDQNKNKGGGTLWARLMWLYSGWIAGPPPVDDDDWFSLEEGYDSDYSITADFLLSPHNPPNWHRRRQRKRLLIKAGHFNFSSSDEEGRGEDGEGAGRRHHRRHHRHTQQQSPSQEQEEGDGSPTTPGSIGINLGPATSATDYITEWYFKRRSYSGSGFIEDDTFSYNHIIATPEVERIEWKDVFDGEDGDIEDEDGDCCDGNSATESHGQLELSS